MTAIFISHRATDGAEAQALKDWLSGQGHEQLFLDFDPANGIPAGVDWEHRLYQELRRCQALLIVLTPAWLESMWCRNELAIAREKGKAIFVVRVKPCAAGPVIPALQEVDLTRDGEAALAKLARGLKEHGLDPTSAFDWRPGRPIYPGLAAFEVDDAAVYFGRSDESWQVVETLRRMRLQALGSPKLLLITGASGSGKSSLMRAGVLARLRKEETNWIIARPFRRGGDGLLALADALAWAYPSSSRPAGLQALTAHLAGADGAGQLISIARELRLAFDRPEATLVLALDQAEEVLASEQAEDGSRLLDLLRAALAWSSNELLVLATIRSDRLGEWQKHPSVKATADHGELPFEVLPLGPMPMARIGEIVRGPAAYEGLHIEDELIQAIRADTNTPDALPLLAYTLRYLHDRFAGDGRLTLADYDSFGGLEGSIRSQADAAIPIDRLEEEDRRALREAFVPGLVRATLADTFSRSRTRLATLPSRAEPYLRRLIDDARLLQTDRDLQGHVTVEVAHEALLRVWPTLVRWIEDDALNLRRLAAVQRAAADWAANAQGPDFIIHREHRLTEAEALVREPRFAARLEDVDREYLASCRTGQDQREAQEREARERELQAARELAARRRAQLRLAWVAAIGSLMLVVLAGWQWHVASSAQDAAERATHAAEDGKRQLKDQLDRANVALAASIWSDLDFTDPDKLAIGELRALWSLTMEAQLRQAFMSQLWSDPDRMRRFARRPGPIGRALGLNWPSPQQAQDGLGLLLNFLKESNQPNDIDPASLLARVLVPHLPVTAASEAFGHLMERPSGYDWPLGMRQLSWDLAKRVPPGDVAGASERVLRLLAGGPDPRSVAAFSLALQSLASTLAPAEASRAVRTALDGMKATPKPEVLRHLSQAVRAFRSTLTAGEAKEAEEAISTALTEKLSPSDLQAVAEAIQVLPIPFKEELTQRTLSLALEAFSYVTIPKHRSHDLDVLDMRAVAGAMSALTDKLSADQARIALTTLAELISKRQDEQAEIFAPSLQGLANRIATEEAGPAFRPLLRATESAFGSSARQALVTATFTVADKLAAEATQDELREILPLIQSQTADNSKEISGSIARALAGRLPPERAQAALPPVIEAMRTAATPAARTALAKVIEQLKVPLTPEQAKVALGRVLEPIGQANTNPADMDAVSAVRALAGQLAIDQVKIALVKLTGAIGQSETAEARSVIADSVGALVNRLSADQARELLAPILAALADAARFEELRPLLQVLPREIAAEARTKAFHATLAALPIALSDYHTVRPVAQMMEVLAGHLDAEQTQAALMVVLDAIARAGEFRSEDVTSLTRTVATLAKALSVDQRRVASPAIIASFGSAAAASPRKRKLLLQVIQELGIPLTPAQESASQFGLLLKLTETDDPRQILELAQALIGQVSAEQLSPILANVQSKLGLSTSEDEAAGWAAALEELLRKQNAAARVAAILEAIKLPLAAGSPTDLLLEALRDADPNAPGKQAGIDANLSWLRIAYPEVDQEKPPLCPLELRQGNDPMPLALAVCPR